mmetsp:Transcript_4697/g.6332  ORF Transcript_4697/g.6332 Transcript_4697/m.6332 type:complete len:115 (+) Transcript_4697:334-678(+)
MEETYRIFALYQWLSYRLEVGGEDENLSFPSREAAADASKRLCKLLDEGLEATRHYQFDKKSGQLKRAVRNHQLRDPKDNIHDRSKDKFKTPKIIHRQAKSVRKTTLRKVPRTV